MAIGNIYKLHSLALTHGTPSNNVIFGSMNSVGMPTDAEVVREVNASRLYAYQGHVNFRSASINLTTWNVAGALATIPATGLCIDSSGSLWQEATVTVAKFDCNSAVAAGATVYTVNKGIIYPTSLTVDHQGNAQLSLTIIAIFDGTNDPIGKSINQAVPTVPAEDAGPPVVYGEDQRWTMYDVTIDGAATTQIKSINFDFGAQTSTEGADSEAYDSWVSLDQVLPVMTLQGLDPDWLETVTPTVAGSLTLGGETVASTDTTVRLKARDTAATGAGNERHVTIGVNGVGRVTDPFSSTGNDAGRTEMRIDAHQIGANAPLVIATGVLLP